MNTITTTAVPAAPTRHRRTRRHAIGLMLVGAYFLLAVVGYLAFAEWAGITAARLANWQAHPAWALLVGLAILGVVTLVPFIGPLVGFVAVVLGLGAVTLTAWAAYHPTATVLTQPISAPTATPLPAPA